MSESVALPSNTRWIEPPEKVQWWPQPPPWKAEAACTGADPDVFFPERGASVREARAICRGCPVRIECLDFALENRELFGIWGGKTEKERRSLRALRARRHLSESP